MRDRLGDVKSKRITRMRHRIQMDQEIAKAYHIDADLTKETTDEIEKCLYGLKDSMDLKTEEIEMALECRKDINIPKFYRSRKI
ncbi:hypothetical protein CMI47_19495 [Candidatus Pacearchaeota archaeon]|nr:hypothetical protein [Candidatus Pacearchaeota archaeon]|tara:strand:+ start:132 stop:383 length:252 start_codon:yes stop_codon:yes gene_type:complete